MELTDKISKRRLTNRERRERSLEALDAIERVVDKHVKQR
jgi:hypothetical protein